VELERHVLSGRGRELVATLCLAALVACGKARSEGAPAAQGGSSGAASAGSGGGGGGEDLRSVAEPLDGVVLKGACGRPVGGRLCETSTERPYPRRADTTIVGALLTDTTVTLGGDPRILYDIELSVEGIVEARSYAGGSDQSQASELPADGWYVGGKPRVGNAGSVYLLRVTEPAQDYFLNAVATADDTRLRRSVFPVKYAATVRARGGTTVRLVLADPNAHAVQNCADPDEDGCTPVTHDFVDPKLLVAAGVDAAPFDGQFLGLLVTGVARAPAP
jgi:hypothetical protein